MITAYSEEEIYKLQAIDISAQAVINQLDAYVHVEGNIDVNFWKITFEEFTPKLKIDFIWETRSPHSEKASGVYQCLKYKDYLSKQFFICIDSDYRYLLQEAGISAANFIFQTYTYSIENHFCFSKKLNSIPEKCTGIENTVFDFEAFLLAYSQAVYEAFIWHLHFLKQGDISTFSKDEFNRILSLNGMPGFSINSNGEVIINELTTRCKAKVAELTAAYPLAVIATEQAHFTTLGLTSDNAYLYVRGHNLYDLIVKLGNEVNNQLLRTEAGRLANEQAIAQLYAKATPFQRELERLIVFDEYNEIEKIGTDLNTLFH